jgi:hypothetical protein
MNRTCGSRLHRLDTSRTGHTNPNPVAFSQ